MYLKDVLKNLNAPRNFTLVLNGQSGKYIIGSDKFAVSEFHVTNILQRQLTSIEEYVLGILSIFLIAILADISQTLLLRTSKNRVHLNGVLSAHMVHELSHFRNIWAHLKPEYPLHVQRALWVRRRAYLSITVLGITIGLFAADVIAVLLTQPVTTSSNKDQYNLVAVQPIGTSLGVSRYIRRLSPDRPCVSPALSGSHQTRNFLINACTQFDIVNKTTGYDDVSESITIASWFHRGGSDHNITVGSARIGIKIRVDLVLGADKGGVRRLLFRSLDDANLTHAKYLHKLAFHGALDWACRKTDTSACKQLEDEIKIDSRIERRQIILWRGKTDDVRIIEDGRVTTAKLGLKEPFRAINSGLRALVTSAAILEVGQKGKYVRVRDDAEEDGIESLLSEDGRVAGLALFGIALGILATVMVLLRVFLKPVSLGHVALSSIDQTRRVDLVSKDFFEGVDDLEYWECVKSLGAAGLAKQSSFVPQRRDEGNGEHEEYERGMDTTSFERSVNGDSTV